MKRKYTVIISAILTVMVLTVFSGCGKAKNQTGASSGKEQSKAKVEDSNKNVGKDGKNSSNSNTGSSNTPNATSDKGAKGKTQNTKDGEGANSYKMPVLKPGEKVGIASKEATVGSLVNVVVDYKQLDKKKATYYRVYYKNKPVSKMVKVGKETTMYPSQEKGTKVQIKLFDKGRKETCEIKAKIQ